MQTRFGTMKVSLRTEVAVQKSQSLEICQLTINIGLGLTTSLSHPKYRRWLEAIRNDEKSASDSHFDVMVRALQI